MFNTKNALKLICTPNILKYAKDKKKDTICKRIFYIHFTFHFCSFYFEKGLNKSIEIDRYIQRNYRREERNMCIIPDSIENPKNNSF